MIRGRDGFDSIVAPRWSQSEFCNSIRMKAVVVPVRWLSPGIVEAVEKLFSGSRGAIMIRGAAMPGNKDSGSAHS